MYSYVTTAGLLITSHFDMARDAVCVAMLPGDELARKHMLDCKSLLRTVHREGLSIVCLLWHCVQ
jgi:hypothetical protein